MSLINEALRKARQEAAEQEAEERAAGGTKGKAAYREPRAHLPARSKMGVGLAVGVLLGVLAASGGGLGIWWLTARAADSESESDPTPVSVVGDPAPEAPKQASSVAPPAPKPTATEISTLEKAPPAEPTPPAEAPRKTSKQTPTPTQAPTRAEPAAAAARPTSEPVQPETEVASSEPMAVGSEPIPDPEGQELPKLIEPPETIGRVGKTNVFVLEADLGDGKVVLDFIVWNPSSPFAQINGKQVEVGQLVAGLLVESIERDRVTLKATDGRIVLRVR